MDSDVNIPLTSPAFSCPDVSNCSSGQVFGTSTPSDLWDFFPFIFYKECSQQHFITATSLLLVLGRQSAQRFEMVLCPFVMQEGWSEVLDGYIFFFSFWLNKQPCFWKAGSSVSLYKKGNKAQAAAVNCRLPRLWEYIFLYHYFLLLLARCSDSIHKCNIGICQQQRQKKPQTLISNGLPLLLSLITCG